jgi:hypothetical protein
LALCQVVWIHFLIGPLCAVFEGLPDSIPLQTNHFVDGIATILQRGILESSSIAQGGEPVENGFPEKW